MDVSFKRCRMTVSRSLLQSSKNLLLWALLPDSGETLVKIFLETAGVCAFSAGDHDLCLCRVHALYVGIRFDEAAAMVSVLLMASGCEC